MKRQHEVTVNLEYPTAETLNIPTEWEKSKCGKCGASILIDLKNKKVHHKEPFCQWYHKAWVTPIMMEQAIDSYLFDKRMNYLNKHHS